MGYIAKAFAIISDTKSQKELTDRLDKMFPNDEGNHLEDASCFVADEGCIYKSYFCPVIDFIDCNHYANDDEDLAIALFLALAEMRGDTDKNQWYQHTYLRNDNNRVLGGKSYLYIRKSDIPQTETHNTFALSPLELAEAVRTGAITKEQIIN